MTADEIPWPTEPPPDDDYSHDEDAIQYRMMRLRIEQEARRRLADENRVPIALPPVTSLDTLLAQPDSPTRYRIEGVAPVDSRIILSAQYKAGKTTLVGNLLRSLVDGDPFLGRFTVHQPSRRVVLIDVELAKKMLRRWLGDQGIRNTGAVADVVALRGRVGTFNLLDDGCRDQWATRLRDLGADYLVLDCLRPVLDALGLDENRDAGRFLAAFDALLAEAGISDAAVVHHMGHGSERSRGDSRLQDWPDAIWRLVRQSEEPDSPRYFSAYGRDVSVSEGRISFDTLTRRATYVPGSRSDASTEAALRAVTEVMAAVKDAGLTVRGAQEALADGTHSQKAIREALKSGLSKGLFSKTTGERGAHLHRITHPCSVCNLPVASGRSRHESCPASVNELEFS